MKKSKKKKQLVNQYDDVCGNCPFKSIAMAPKDQLWCSEYDQFMVIDKLKESGIFCDKGRKRLRYPKNTQNTDNTKNTK